MNGIQEVSGSIPLISTKEHHNKSCGVLFALFDVFAVLQEMTYPAGLAFWGMVWYAFYNAAVYGIRSSYTEGGLQQCVGR